MSGEDHQLKQNKRTEDIRNLYSTTMCVHYYYYHQLVYMVIIKKFERKGFSTHYGYVVFDKIERLSDKDSM